MPNLRQGEKTSYHDILFGLLKALLVRDALELVTLLDQLSVLKLDLVLLLHDLGDLLRHHVGHLLTHIILQLFQIVEFLYHLSGQKEHVRVSFAILVSRYLRLPGQF